MITHDARSLRQVAALLLHRKRGDVAGILAVMEEIESTGNCRNALISAISAPHYDLIGISQLEEMILYLAEEE
jgi:hypothetical protein